MVLTVDLQANEQSSTILVNDRVLPWMPGWQVPSLWFNLASNMFHSQANYVGNDGCARVALCHLYHPNNSMPKQNHFCSYGELGDVDRSPVGQ